MKEVGSIEELLDETETLLNDLLLSGFQGVHEASLTQIQELMENYERLEMNTGIDLLYRLHEELMKRKSSFTYDLEKLMGLYSQLSFYLETCKTSI